MPHLQSGDVIRVMAFFCNPHKYKFMICIDPKIHKSLIINTNAYRLAMPAQMLVTAAEVPGLDHDSYIDTSKLTPLSLMETQNAVDADPRCYKGSISTPLRQSIKALIIQHGIMPKDQMALVATNL